MSVDEAANGVVHDAFARELGEQLDEAMTSYISALLLEEQDDLELQEMLCGYSPAFEALPPEQQATFVDGLRSSLADLRSATDQAGMRSGSGSGSGSGGGAAGPQPAVVPLGQPADEPATEDAEAAALQALGELCPGPLPEEYLRHLLRQHQGRLQEAAAWMLDQTDLPAQAAAWQRERERAKQAEQELARKIIARYDVEAVPEGPPAKPSARQPALAPWSATANNSSSSNAKARFRDGVLVSTKGEKFILTKDKEEWDGGSKGKVYTKGKRGKGFA